MSEPTQLTLHEVRLMAPEEVTAARKDGQLQALLDVRHPLHADAVGLASPGGADQGARGSMPTGTALEQQRDRLRTMRPEEIVAAHKRGEFDELLGRPTKAP